MEDRALAATVEREAGRASTAWEWSESSPIDDVVAYVRQQRDSGDAPGEAGLPLQILVLQQGAWIQTGKLTHSALALE